MIGIPERYGLRELAGRHLQHQGSHGRVTTIYISYASLLLLSPLRLGGHVQFIRPLVYPMALAPQR